MIRLQTLYLPCLCAVFLLSGCSSAKDTLGLNKSVPDEFAVVKRAPLAMPPNYSLRPPEPGAARPQEQMMSEQAEETLFGDSASTHAQQTSGDSTFLQQAGADASDIDPDIRKRVDTETLEVDASNKPVVDRILNIGNDEPATSVVDAAKEAERLKQNAEDGRAVTDGDTPSIVE